MKLNVFLGTLLTVAIVAGCKTQSKWNPRIFAASPSDSSIKRQEGKEVIKCASPEFKEMVCMSYEDLNKVYGECLNKKMPKWYWPADVK